RRRHTRFSRDWSSDVCSSDLNRIELLNKPAENMIPDQISNGIENITSLELKSNQSSFSFQFAAVANVLNTNYHYAYRLKGFDERSEERRVGKEWRSGRSRYHR